MRGQGGVPGTSVVRDTCCLGVSWGREWPRNGAMDCSNLPIRRGTKVLDLAPIIPRSRGGIDGGRCGLPLVAPSRAKAIPAPRPRGIVTWRAGGDEDSRSRRDAPDGAERVWGGWRWWCFATETCQLVAVGCVLEWRAELKTMTMLPG